MLTCSRLERQEQTVWMSFFYEPIFLLILTTLSPLSPPSPKHFFESFSAPSSAPPTLSNFSLYSLREILISQGFQRDFHEDCSQMKALAMLRLSQAAQGKGARNCVGNRVGMREIGGFVDCGAGNIGLPDSHERGKNGDCVSGARHFWG